MIAFTGINLRNRTVSGSGNSRCGNIDWVPWDCGGGSWAAQGLEHLHNSITPPKSLHDDLAREIWRGEQFVEKEAHEVVHEAEVVEHFIAKEARLLAEEARVVGSDIRHLEHNVASGASTRGRVHERGDGRRGPVLPVDVVQGLSSIGSTEATRRTRKQATYKEG